MSNEQPGPQIPQRVDTASELYQILRERLRQLILHTLRASPEQYQNNDEANRCKEALKLWANNVGVCRGVLTILDEHKTWEMRNDMFECLWALHSAVEDMEVGVGWRPMRTDKKPARARPFEYFHSLIYTYSQDTERFSSLAITYPHYKTSNSTPTPPPTDLRNPLEPSPIPSSTRSEPINQNHLRNDSHSEYIKKEEPSPSQRYQNLGSPSQPWVTGLPDSRVKMEDKQANYHRQTKSMPFSPSASMSPNISDRTHLHSPARSSPNVSEQWSPQSSINSTLPYPASSLEENRRSHHNHNWASTVLHHEEQPVVMQMRIPPNPPFQSISHSSILPPPESLRLGTSPPRVGSWFTSFQQSPASSPPSRRPDS